MNAFWKSCNNIVSNQPGPRSCLKVFVIWSLISESGLKEGRNWKKKKESEDVALPSAQKQKSTLG